MLNRLLRALRADCGACALLPALALGAPGSGAAPGAEATAPIAVWDTSSDTWVATDALGRSLPAAAEVGSPRPNKTVGIFYFLWLGQHGKSLYDNTKLLAANPANPAYGPKGAFHFWGEPAFGYYLSDDESVIRKHAQMLADAGVDVLIFDVTNGPTYDNVVRAIGRVLTQMRREGLRTPQFAFITHSSEGKVVQALYDKIYGPALYADLWFRWQGCCWQTPPR
jgi:hypothetical protein